MTDLKQVYLTVATDATIGPMAKATLLNKADDLIECVENAYAEWAVWVRK